MSDTLSSSYAQRYGGFNTDETPQIGPSGKPIYSAFAAKDKLVTLDIRCAHGTGRTPLYGLLMDVIYGRKHHAGCVLVFNHMVVTIKGRNLQKLILALKARKAEYIEEWSEEFEPPSEGEAVIESMQIDAREMMEAM